MSWVALRMLTGERGKYFGIVFGVTFASLLMAHQSSIFVGIMRRTTSQIQDVVEADIWVMDPKVRYVDEVQGLVSTELQRVRGVPGVDWAVPLFKGNVRARLGDGNFRQAILLGVDDASLVGAPREMVLGLSGSVVPVTTAVPAQCDRAQVILRTDKGARWTPPSTT